MAYTTPTTRSTSDLITASIWNTDLVDNIIALKSSIDGLAFQSIAEADLSGGDAASMSFTSISGSFTHLFLIGSVKSDDTTARTDNMNLQFNSDTGSNYEVYQFMATTSDNSGTNTAINSGMIMTAHVSNTTNDFSSFVMFIPNYADTNMYKNVVGITNAGDQQINVNGGLWNNTAAITRIDLSPATGSNLKQYSKVTLFGLQL